jgi:hypothetical protein
MDAVGFVAEAPRELVRESPKCAGPLSPLAFWGTGRTDATR